MQHCSVKLCLSSHCLARWHYLARQCLVQHLLPVNVWSSKLHEKRKQHWISYLCAQKNTSRWVLNWYWQTPSGDLMLQTHINQLWNPGGGLDPVLSSNVIKGSPIPAKLKLKAQTIPATWQKHTSSPIKTLVNFPYKKTIDRSHSSTASPKSPPATITNWSRLWLQSENLLPVHINPSAHPPMRLAYSTMLKKNWKEDMKLIICFPSPVTVWPQ